MVLTPTTEAIPLTVDAHGVLRVGHTRVTLDTMLAAFAGGEKRVIDLFKRVLTVYLPKRRHVQSDVGWVSVT